MSQPRSDAGEAGWGQSPSKATACRMEGAPSTLPALMGAGTHEPDGHQLSALQHI